MPVSKQEFGVIIAVTSCLTCYNVTFIKKLKKLGLIVIVSCVLHNMPLHNIIHKLPSERLQALEVSTNE